MTIRWKGCEAARRRALLTVLALVLSPGPWAQADGFLLVTSRGNDSILRYDATTGAFIDVFVASGSGGLAGVDLGIARGPDGNIYVNTQIALDRLCSRPRPLGGRGRVQCHRGANKRPQRLFINLVALMEIDGTPGVAFEAGVEET
jgi:hypothetical protein